MFHSLRRFIERAGWSLPLALFIILAVAQFGKQVGLIALGHKIPMAGLIVTGMVIMTPSALLVWTGLTMLVVNNTRPSGRDLKWPEVTSLYLLASLTHVIFTGVDLTFTWLTGSRMSNVFSFLRGIPSFIFTIDAMIATVTFFLLTAWYVRGLGPRTRLTLADNRGEACA